LDFPFPADPLPEEITAKKKRSQCPGEIYSVKMPQIDDKRNWKMDKYKPHKRKLSITRSQISTWDIDD
jgi:hypothetical protein